VQTATVKWAGEEKFVATSPSGHAINMDSDRHSNTAPGPMELLLMAWGLHGDGHREHPREEAAKAGVAGSDLLGERAAEPPTVWTKLEIVLPPPRAARGQGGEARHSAQRG